MAEPTHTPHQVDLSGAAAYLELDEDAVRALIAVGYLRPAGVGDRDDLQDGDGQPVFALADLKAFIARNADNGSGNIANLLDQETAGDPQVLLDALQDRCDTMARRAFDIFAAAFPEAQHWSLSEQVKFIEQARGRFEAILAVTGQGSAVDDALVDDLQAVGGAAAWSGSPLPQLLAVLRISRDLVVQSAVELAEQRGRHWGLALSLLLTRVLPAMDALTDALAQGYWAALVSREEDLRERYQHVVETSSNGVFEVDLDGQIRYANSALGVILGRQADQCDGVSISEVVVPAEPGESVEVLMRDTPDQVQLTVLRPDGARREIEVSTTARYRADELTGYQGVVRDVTAERDLERERNEFLALVTNDLRTPLASLLAQGANLEAHAAELAADQVARIGGAVRNHVERIARLADDLYDASRLDASELTLRTRPVELAPVVRAALASVPGHEVAVEIPEGVEVMADPRRLEQVVGNLLESSNAVQVRMGVTSTTDTEIVIAGAAELPWHRALLVRSLVEAMGGRLSSGPTDSTITLPLPRIRT